MTHHSEPQLLVLHAVRVLGFADTDAIVARSQVPDGDAKEILREAKQCNWIEYSSFADLAGWSLTEAGKQENERQLAIEREIADPNGAIRGAYLYFRSLNAQLLSAVTDWQIHPTPTDSFATNDHSDREWDAQVLAELTELSTELPPLVSSLSRVLARFSGYDHRFSAALSKAKNGDARWVDKSDIDSCHRVWFQLHEDLVVTLGIDRFAERF